MQQIIQRSVAANKRDFEEAPNFNHKERDRGAKGSKEYQVVMLEGSPYDHLLAINGKPLTTAQAAEEDRKQKEVEQKRKAESSSERQQRIAKYQKDRKRDGAMMTQLTEAFNFTLIGQHKLRGFAVWVLKATPRPGYRPPNMDTQVLTGMQGEMWIDQKTYQWVRVTAQVVHPVSIEGFLAQVEPGTRFEVEKSPVSGDIWQFTHFAMKASAKVLFMFNHSSQDDETYFDFERINP